METILNEIKQGDYLMVQFGINDSNATKEERYAPICGSVTNATLGSFEYYIKMYVEGALAHGAKPILLSPTLGLKSYANGQFVNSYTNYAQAMQSIAQHYNITYIDLNSQMVKLYNSVGYNAAKLYHLCGVVEGSTDMTHFSEAGANKVAELVGKAFLSAVGGNNPQPPSEEKKPISNYVTLNDGWYYIKNTNAQKYLGVKDNRGANGQNVEISTGTGVDGQKWYLTNVGDGYVTLKNGTNYMLDVDYGKDEDGANIGVYTANGLSAQMFKIIPTKTSHTYGIVTKASIDTKALDVYNFGTADGSNVCQWTYYENTCQTWVFEPCNAPGQTQPEEPENPEQPQQPGQPEQPEQGEAPNNTISIKISSDWTSGAVADLTVTNTTGKDLNGWTCTFTSNRPITSVWNGELVSQSGNTYIVKNPEWQPNLAKDKNYTFGCQFGSGPSDIVITNVTLK